jgi:hypothetical protein
MSTPGKSAKIVKSRLFRSATAWLPSRDRGEPGSPFSGLTDFWYFDLIVA